jgi:NADP-dependent 3-hydroxy acid dehydrogenase YdfG
VEKVVLVTGAAGRIGSAFARYFREPGYSLHLMVRDGEDAKELAGLGEVVRAELTDADSLARVTRGVDTIIHLAGDPGPSSVWKDLLDANIVGTYNIVTAALANRCRRFVYASSIHAVSGYPADVQVKTTEPVNPGDLYGVSKCFGEALCRYVAEQEGMSAVAIRIGAFQPLEAARDPDALGMMDAFVSERDLCQLLSLCVTRAPELRFAVLHGLSDNRFKRLDISTARELFGYVPQDDFTRENPELRGLRLAETVSAHNVQDEGSESGLREEVGALSGRNGG